MASASVVLPDDLDSTLEIRWHYGTLHQSEDRPNVNPSNSLLIYFEDQEWRNDAACSRVDPDIFFPDRGVTGERIRDICFRCPVRLDCLDYSVSTMPKFGWFGGHPEEGRKQIRKLMKRGANLDTADSIVLADSLAKIRQRKREEKTRRFDLELGDVILGEVNLAAS